MMRAPAPEPPVAQQAATEAGVGRALCRSAQVAKLVDAAGLGPAAARCGGSIPFLGTKNTLAVKPGTTTHPQISKEMVDNPALGLMCGPP